MFEKVNPSHPDKVADRIAGAIVDLAYAMNNDPHIAVEVLVGHGDCNIIIESNTIPEDQLIKDAVYRITNTYKIRVNILTVPQDGFLAGNQANGVRCGDNGIFKGCVITREQQLLANVAGDIYGEYPSDGKYIIRSGIHGENFEIIVCQSNLSKSKEAELDTMLKERYRILYNIINPLGEWTGGLDVDCGATNRKLGSDMGDSVTGGGLHGKDLSKADVSVNIFAWLMVNNPSFLLRRGIRPKINNSECWMSCAIGDEMIDGYKYSDIVEVARDYIKEIGGFEKFAEWGLIRPEIYK